MPSEPINELEFVGHSVHITGGAPSVSRAYVFGAHGVHASPFVDPADAVVSPAGHILHACKLWSDLYEPFGHI